MKYIVEVDVWHPSNEWQVKEVSTHNWYIMAVFSFLNTGGTVHIRKLTQK